MASSNSDILAFEFPHAPSHLREDFYVSKSNRRAHEAVCGESDWPNGSLVLTGPPRSGKTHLLKVWIAASGAREIEATDLTANCVGEMDGGGKFAIDGVDGVAARADGEESLLHLCNIVADGGGRLLLASRTVPSRWEIGLPDLRSRLEGFQLARIEEPDDVLLAVLLTKLFADRQISVAPKVVQYIIPRMRRSHLAAHDIVDSLDELSFVEKGRINFQMAARALRAVEADGGSGR